MTTRIRNVANDQTWEGLFLVNTGAIDCLVPASRLREIGLQPRATRNYELADGNDVTLDIATAEVEFMGDIVGATVIFGPENAEPILGVTALESAGITVDPRTQQLKRLHAISLK